MRMTAEEVIPNVIGNLDDIVDSNSHHKTSHKIYPY